MTALAIYAIGALITALAFVTHNALSPREWHFSKQGVAGFALVWPLLLLFTLVALVLDAVHDVEWMARGGR